MTVSTEDTNVLNVLNAPKVDDKVALINKKAESKVSFEAAPTLNYKMALIKKMAEPKVSRDADAVPYCSFRTASACRSQ